MSSSDGFWVYHFQVDPIHPYREIVLAELAECGFDSFEETEGGLKAYARPSVLRENWWEDLYSRRHAELQLSFKQEKVPDINWNAEWEKNFEPIEIGTRCRVRADFHPYVEVDYDLIISPKMSFGTGHHQTTYMMLEFLLENPLQDLSLLDMGSGTGVLAILASKRGAINLKAVDIDSWATENAKENLLLNSCEEIEVYQGDVSVLEPWHGQFDWVLANINRNILLQDIPEYVRCLQSGGVLLMSGFYSEDLSLITAQCSALGGTLEKKRERDNWVAAKYVF